MLDTRKIFWHTLVSTKPATSSFFRTNDDKKTADISWQAHLCGFLQYSLYSLSL